MTLLQAATLLKQRGGKRHSKNDKAELKDFQEAWQAFDDICNIVPKSLKPVKKHSWQNSGNITTYAWLMFCTDSYFDILKQDKLKNLSILPLTVSFFCNRFGDEDDYKIRVCLELKHEAVSSQQLKDYYELLSSLEPIDGLMVFDENTEKRLAKSATPFSNKLFGDILPTGEEPLFFSIGFMYDIVEDDIVKANIEKGFNTLLPIYEKIMEKYDNRGVEPSITDSSSILEAKQCEEPVFPKNLIFYGAPGTGKTYRTVNQAVAICQKVPVEQIDSHYENKRDELTKIYRDLVASRRIRFVTFHQSYSYEDFVIGIFPKLLDGKDNGSSGLGYIQKDGLFKSLCDEARLEENKDKNFVLIIDEINRGNISKIFGELITLIEETKREGESEETVVELPYLNNSDVIHFSVPSNVYIIGTMNTADRSIQHVDTALRRRFVFKEMLPEARLLSGLTITDAGKTIQIDKLLETINKRIKRYFDREHVIGHSFFMGLKNMAPSLSEKEKLTKLGEIFHNEIIPMLQDYFFEDYSRIQKVLGETPETPANQALIRFDLQSLNDPDEGLREVYEIAPEGDYAYTNIETYDLMCKE